MAHDGRRVWALRYVAQQYAWGKLGADSVVAELLAAQGDTIDASTPYAELWIGTHVNGPSRLRTGPLLADHIAQHPSRVLGEACAAFGSGRLPFLLKVLAIRQPLSLQAHPDKELAHALHAEQPEIYKDANHKPEIAIALTPMRALCGFRPLSEIAAHVQALPELRALMGADAAKTLVHAAGEPEHMHAPSLRRAFEAMMLSSPTHVIAQVDSLCARLHDCAARSAADDLFLELSALYSHDVGVFAAYLLNAVVLAPGEAVFLAANEPHAYLSGDCVECMAASDNVVRAGLTPKHKDVPTLVRMLTWRTGPPPKLSGAPAPGAPDGATCALYQPPATYPDFQVERWDVHEGRDVALPPLPSASLVLVLRGAGTLAQAGSVHAEELTMGTAILVEAGVNVHVMARADVALVRASMNTRREV